MMNTNTLRVRSPRHQAGVTLVELMVALVMTLFLMGGILVMYTSGRASFLDNSQVSRIQENVRFATDYMIRDIRTAGFHDETTLKVGHEEQIRTNFAEIVETEGEPAALRVRYAGRGHCSETFQEFRLVENEYTIDDEGNLVCSGRAVAQSEAGDVQVAEQDWVGPIELVGGVSDISFEMVCPDGGSACECDMVTNFANACIGVRITMVFDGLLDYSSEDADPSDKRTIELNAAFRNVILAQKNELAFGES
jgi:type II secretory pathway component PulJ